MKKLDIEFVRDFLIQRNFKLLSKNYKGISKKFIEKINKNLEECIGYIEEKYNIKFEDIYK